MNANTTFSQPEFAAVEAALATARDSAESPKMAVEFDKLLQEFVAGQHRVRLADLEE